MDRIGSLAKAREFPDATTYLGSLMAAFSGGGSQPQADTPGAGLTVAEIFARMPEAFRADKAAGVDVVFQYTISGAGGGEWHAIIRDQACQVHAGRHEKPTTTIQMAADDFTALIQGKLNAMQAYTKGQLKIGGDLMKSQLIEKLFKF
jgi:putative sterol carrier protein